MRTVNIREAKTHLSRLVDEVYSGEEIIIAKAGKPLAKLVALTATAKKRKLGILKGKLSAPEDFDAPLPEEVLTSFEGN
jgi:prevent-host-death family protein